MSNLKKDAQLNMPYGTACNRLRRMIMFDLMQRLGLDNCVRCGKTIETVKEFSIDHIKPWLDASPDLFWDLNNIGFAHRSCNYRAARQSVKSNWPNPHPPRGIEHKDAKLTDSAVRSIRQRYAAGEIDGPELAKEYGVHHSTIYDVIHHRAWSHID